MKIALQSLWANKLRTVLTLLGVVIGVASVIAVVTLVNGANTYVATKFTSYGADVFTVSKMPQIITSSEDYVRYQKRKNILFRRLPVCGGELQELRRDGGAAGDDGQRWCGERSRSRTTNIRGYTWQMPALQNLNIVEGAGLRRRTKTMRRMLRSSGRTFRTTSLTGMDPIGQELRVDGAPYTVIGMSEKQGSTFGQSQDNWVGVPLTAYQKSYGTAKTLTIYVKAGAAGPVLEAAADEVRVLMRSRRHDAPGAPDSFELDTNNTLVGFFSTVTQSFGAVAGAIAPISLVVGGIVIMNIMLVSVTERTREIGMRKALGARPKDILLQFLMESATMALVGGVIGVAGRDGRGAGGDDSGRISLDRCGVECVGGVGRGDVTGIFFGVYPARKAAELDPIVALRAE